jgi:predicted DNA-binding protein (MmcQ/YjbR family)
MHRLRTNNAHDATVALLACSHPSSTEETMTLDEARALCLSQAGAEETLPFGPDNFVYKVMGKMYALLPVTTKPGEKPYLVTKVDPPFGQLLRDTYPGIVPAWHFDKKHWISIDLDGSVPDDEVKGLLEHSYALVVKGLTRAQRTTLAEQTGHASP